MKRDAHLTCINCKRSTLFPCFECAAPLCQEHANPVMHLTMPSGEYKVPPKVAWFCGVCLPKGGDDE